MATTVKQVKDDINPEIAGFGDTIYLPNRDAKIAELAYYKAESRGFEPGHEMEDWFAAEQEFIV
jgi:hypothetical protein